MADAPLFYHPELTPDDSSIALSDDTARHVVQVLRMQAGEVILLTNGRGLMAHCTIADVAKKRVNAAVENMQFNDRPIPAVHLAISFTKNASRNEWLMEKATELGVSSITPLITSRSARERIRQERWNTILISAMLQSKQSWLPSLNQPTPFEEALKGESGQKLIAHCMGDEPRIPVALALNPGSNACFFIGPEGDFTSDELTLAKAAGALAISLGTNRLRTETAALAAVAHFYLINHAS